MSAATLLLKGIGRRLLVSIAGDWRWKAASLFFAAVLYFMIRDSIRHDKTVFIPVDIDPRAQIAAATIDPLSVEVTIQGTISELQQFTENNPRFVVHPMYNGKKSNRGLDIGWWLNMLFGMNSDIRGNTEEFRLSSRLLQGGKGRARIVNIEPGIVTVIYDVRGEAVLQVAEPQVRGRPYRGRVVLAYEPREVRVIGSADQVAMMATNGVQLQIEPIEVEGRVQGFKKTAPILQPGMTRLVKFEPAEVTVDVMIVTDRFTRDFTGIPVLLAGLGATGTVFGVQPPTVDIRLSGRVETINSLQTNQVAAMVDMRQYGDGVFTNLLPVKLVVPYDLSIETAEVSPAEVLVVPGVAGAPPGVEAGQ